MEQKIKKLNKSELFKSLGDSLSKIFYNTILEEKEKNLLSDNQINKFVIILGREYSKKLTVKLLEDKDLDKSNIKEKNHLSELSVKIIDIVIQFISNDFDDYITNLNVNENKYKEVEFGNLVVFLLFNNFDQYITLKECLFLLNEDNYKLTNIFKFSSEFKNLSEKNNDDFLKELIDDHKIFNDIFSKYNSLYEVNKNNDLIILKSFRENCAENLNKKIESFKFFNFGLDKNIFFNK